MPNPGPPFPDLGQRPRVGLKPAFLHRERGAHVHLPAHAFPVQHRKAIDLLLDRSRVAGVHGLFFGFAPAARQYRMRRTILANQRQHL